MAVKRVNQSVLGALERPTLAWLAGKAPDWILPDHLTILGLIGAVLAATGFLLSRWSMPWLWLSSLGLAINWLGDSVDGTLARLRRTERPRYGFFVDHASDLFSQVMIFVTIGLSPVAHLAAACLGLIAFLMAFVYTLIGTHVRQRMRITYFGFGPTEIRLLLIIGNLLVLEFGVLDVHVWFPRLLASIGPLTVHDVAISTLACAGVILLVVLAIREVGTLGREDPPPPRPSDSRYDRRLNK
jgi:archaetidylinositol phosphate synthase